MSRSLRAALGFGGRIEDEGFGCKTGGFPDSFIRMIQAGTDGLFDVTAALVSRTEQAVGSVKSTADAIAQAAAAYEAAIEDEEDAGAAD